MSSQRRPIAIAIHGGAGTLRREAMTPGREARYRAGLEKALRAGHDVLRAGGTSLDAAVAAVVVLEDSPLFNAGRGAVFNAVGAHELDAAVMEGAELRAGAVAAVRRVKNPVIAARAVMEKTPHVMLAASGADAFARKTGLEVVEPDYFSTPQRRAALERERLRARAADLAAAASDAERHGTVGAVALDASGTVAAATSTGGFTNKLAGRVGDTPVIGGGTYADNRACAVSATGDGEFFIRRALAYDVTARMRYLGESVAQAAEYALAQVVTLGGSGGLIAIDARGDVAMPFVSEGMYRGAITVDGGMRVAIYRDAT